MLSPSPHQLAIFDFIRTDSRSLCVEAVAGSGKTSTIVEACKLVPRNQSQLFLAFNKNIATELEQRLPQHVQAKTFHSHCNGVLQRTRRRKVDAKKCVWLLKDHLNEKDFFTYGSFVLRLVSYAKSAGHGLLDNTSWENLIEHHSLFLDSERGSEEEAVDIASKLLRWSNEDTDRINFDDMLYFPLLEKLVFDKFNYVWLDEAQDTNMVQRELLAKMLPVSQLIPVKTDSFIPTYRTTNPTSRLIAVGDPNQAIYGFRGADSDAMATLHTEFQAETLPLSVSWRCSKAVVEEARKHFT